MDISSVSFYLIFPTTHIRGNTEDKAGGEQHSLKYWRHGGERRGGRSHMMMFHTEQNKGI